MTGKTTAGNLLDKHISNFLPPIRFYGGVSGYRQGVGWVLAGYSGVSEGYFCRSGCGGVSVGCRWSVGGVSEGCRRLTSAVGRGVSRLRAGPPVSRRHRPDVACSGRLHQAGQLGVTGPLAAHTDEERRAAHADVPAPHVHRHRLQARRRRRRLKPVPGRESETPATFVQLLSQYIHISYYFESSSIQALLTITMQFSAMRNSLYLGAVGSSSILDVDFCRFF